jgi:hypothetical protein
VSLRLLILLHRHHRRRHHRISRARRASANDQFPANFRIIVPHDSRIRGRHALPNIARIACVTIVVVVVISRI